MILPVVFDRFQCLFGTQGAFLLFGGLNFNILVAGVSLRTSADHQLLHNDDHHQEEGWSIRLFLRYYWLVLVRNPDIWFLCSTSFLHYFNMIGWALFLVSLGEELGYSRSRAVLLSSCGGFGALLGRVWTLILFFHNVHNPFQFFGIPALMQCASFIGIVFTRNMFYLSAIMTLVSGISFGTTGAATVGVCALKTSNEDFTTALTILFMICAFGNEIGGGVCGKCLNDIHIAVTLLPVSSEKNRKEEK
ncbi:hypothetical protein HOLleu_32048 [Holothuria leucospilota]|uniref:Uncharacterized protein n=1 Tax=Holothuria leucospilota TaxID=206669 RepID=A0A9Q1BI17_HOLLE|nr:hypothetical protein HOLleu_32048 [Holothuria leucospilota]